MNQENYKSELNRNTNFINLNNNKRNDEKAFSPDRRYMSSIEIPAEQIELLKQRAFVRCRSLSSSNSFSSMNESEITNKKRHKSAVQINDHPQLHSNCNLVSVSLKSLKVPQPEKQTMTEQDELVTNLDKSHKEIESLKRALTEGKELIEMQRKQNEYQQKELLKLNEEKIKDLMSNENLIRQLDEQKYVIENLKTKCDRLKNDGVLSSDAMHTIAIDLEKVKYNLKKLENHNKHQAQANEDLKCLRVKDVSIQVDNENDEMDVNNHCEPLVFVRPMESNHIPDSSLVCNIPEHHCLEDLMHQNREEIARLKSMLDNDSEANNDDLTLLDKRAEFEALDLAIDSRRQLLYNLELVKNNKMDESASINNNASYIQVVKYSFL